MHQPSPKPKIKHRLSEDALRGMLYIGGAFAVGGMIVVIIAILRAS